MFDKVIEISMLFDFYGQLLTEKQREVMHLYYEDDFSLGEIAEDLGISRQAVHDTIKKSERVLKEYEEKLKLFARFKETEYAFNQVIDIINSLLKQYNNDKSLSSELNKIKEIIKDNS